MRGLQPIHRRDESGAIIEVFPLSPERKAEIATLAADAKRRGYEDGLSAARDEAAKTPRAGGRRTPALPAPPPPAPLRPLNLAELAGVPVPQRRWIVPNWLPVGQVTMHYAEGGVGKTLLALQLMVACATGTPWCGLDIQRCASVGLFSEDDRCELHARLDAIRQRAGLTWDQMADAVPIDATGDDNTLVLFDKAGGMVLTPRFHQLRETAMARKARLIVVDTAATTFGGNEIDRSQVTRFIGTALTSLARDIDGAVLVNAHPSTSGISSGAVMSGSTAWSNSARMRWAFTRPTNDDGTLDANARVLERKKANAAAIGEQIRLQWRDGVFEAQGRQTGLAGAFSAIAREADAERVFMALLAKWESPVSANKAAHNYAPKLFAARPDAEGLKRSDFQKAMNSLMAAGRVREDAYGRPSDPRYRLVAVSAEQDMAGEGA